VPTHQADVVRDGRVETRWFPHASVKPADARPLHFVAIQGVSTLPPPVGQLWGGADLADGLKLAVKLQRYAWREQIVAIDVRNYDGQVDRTGPWLRMLAKVPQGQTCIQFGRFPREHGDWEISPDVKLNWLDKLVRDRNGLAKGEIDLRYASPHLRTE